ncbi:MAG: hypothetical protein HYS98_03860 [Deltaproteobacteria bacterium]|nr:hypothetical protein [Deltaproteobacteria bacterium]
MNKLSLPVIARSLKRLHLTDRGNLILLLLSLSITPISFADYKSDYKLKTTIEGVKEQTYKLSRDKWYLPDSESVDFAQAMEEINSGYSVDWSDLWKKYVKMSREITDTSDETWKDLSSAAVGTTGYDTRSPSEKNDFLADVLEHAGFTHIGTNEKGEHIWYPKTMWEKLQDAAKIAFHIDITKINLSL